MLLFPTICYWNERDWYSPCWFVCLLLYLAVNHVLCLFCQYYFCTPCRSGLVCHIPHMSSNMLDTVKMGDWNHSICTSAWVMACISAFQKMFPSVLFLFCMAVSLLHQNFCFPWGTLKYWFVLAVSLVFSTMLELAHSTLTPCHLLVSSFIICIIMSSFKTLENCPFSH